MNRSKIASIRLTDEEYNIIDTKAKKAGLSFSRYVVGQSLQTTELTKSQKQQVYAHLCKIKDCAIQNMEPSKIISECDSLWQFLK